MQLDRGHVQSRFAGELVDFERCVMRLHGGFDFGCP